MTFDRVKLETFEIEEKNKGIRYGFRFQKNKQVCKIYTNDRLVYQQFKNGLRHRCILNSFQEDYHIEKLIGMGTFGKVRMLKGFFFISLN